MNQILQDIRYALRQMRRAPEFALTAVLTLALGVGANSAMFSLLDQALLRSLPVREPKRLAILEGTGKMWEGGASTHGGDPESYFSVPMYRDLRDRAGVFQGLASTAATSVGLARRGDSSTVDAELVSGNYFQMLGTPAALGRVFNAADDTVGGNHQLAVLSYGYWRDKMGADPNLVGQTVRLNGMPVQVVGIAAPNFQSAIWGQTPALFLPMTMAPELDLRHSGSLTDHQFKWINIMGRLRDGVTMPQAEAQLAPLWHALRADELSKMGRRSPRFVDDFLTTSRLHVLPGARGLSYRRDSLETPLLVVMGMALLVLLIAAVNVASLLLVRSSGRVREFAVRYALGATAERLVSQLLLEGLLLGLMGAAAGVALAPLAMRAIASRLVTAGDPAYFRATVDARLLLFSFITATVVSALFSVAPALQLMRPDMVNALKQQVGTPSGGGLLFRRVVVGLQVGLSVLLLVGAGMFVQTLRNLRHAEVGFDTAHLLTLTTVPHMAGISQELTPALFDRMIERLGALPGVTGVAATDSAELAGSDRGSNVTVQGYTPPPDEDLDVGYAAISTGYFATLHTPLLAGREFGPDDDLQHPSVAVVNESFAKHYFGSAPAAIGRNMTPGGGNNLKFRQIVGVVRDVHHSGLRDPAKISFFMPLKQAPKASQITLYLRTREAPLQTAALVRNTMHDIDPGLSMVNLWDMDQQIESDLSNERMIELLAVSFSVLATALAGIGLYGVLAFSVAQRTREIGIRMALGSTRGLVARLVVVDVLRLAGIGVVVAVPLALLAARSLRSQLYGVSAADPLSVGAAVLLIATVALLAAVLPAHRAATVHPNTALRAE